MAKKSRRQCIKCEYIDDCMTIDEWKEKLKSGKIKKHIYNHQITSASDDCPDYKTKTIKEEKIEVEHKKKPDVKIKKKRRNRLF